MDLILNNAKINSLSIDKIIEKPICLETMKYEVQKISESYSIIQLKPFYRYQNLTNRFYGELLLLYKFYFIY